MVLADLDEDEFLILITKSTDHFVQFAAQGASGMRVEAQNNSFIETEEYKLSEKAHAQLLSLGWNEPTYEFSIDETEPPDGSPNYYIDIAVPVPYAPLAALAIETLQQIYNVRYPSELKYAAFSYEGVQIRFPLLGIQREKS